MYKYFINSKSIFKLDSGLKQMKYFVLCILSLILSNHSLVIQFIGFLVQIKFFLTLNVLPKYVIDINICISFPLQ